MAQKETILASGMFFRKPSAKAPEYILGNISVNKNEFGKWLAEQATDEDGFVRLEVKESKKTGKPYVALDQWTPGSANAKPAEPDGEDDF